MANPPRTLLSAIPSTALSRAAPRVPPASDVYEPLVKGVLRARQRGIYAASGGLCWALAIVWMSWAHRGQGTFKISAWVLTPFRPGTVALAVASWSFVALPVLIVRKVTIAEPPTLPVSPATALRDSRQNPRAMRLLAVYTASAMAAMLLNLTVAYAAETEDPRLALFGKSKKYPFHLNGRFVYLLFSQLALAWAYFARDALRDRLFVRWSSPSRDPTLPDLASLLPATLLPISLFTLLILTTYTILFGAARALMLPVILRLPVLNAFVKPFAGLWLRSRNGWTLWLPLRHAALIGRTWLLSMCTTATWAWAQAVFDEFVSAPMSPSTASASPSLALVTGTTSSSNVMRLAAYRELAQLAREDSPSAKAARAAIFSDQKHAPGMWAVFVRQSLVVLGEDYQRLLRRGAPALAPAMAPATKNPAPTRPIPSTPLIKSQIFRTPATKPQFPLKSLADSLGADGAISQAVDEVASTGESVLPELFRSVRGASAGTGLEKSIFTPAKEKLEVATEMVKQAANVVPESAERVKGALRGHLEGVVEKYMPPTVREAMKTVHKWWSAERLHRIAERCVPHAELDERIVVALSHMIAASLDEDALGVAQRDIPRVLEALVLFYSAAGAYRKELAARYKVLSPEQAATLSPAEYAERVDINKEVEQASQVVDIVGNAMKDGIGRIVLRFGERLAAFKFPPATATKLQEFVNFAA